MERVEAILKTSGLENEVMSDPRSFDDTKKRTWPIESRH